jgi:hypothetical protein
MRKPQEILELFSVGHVFFPSHELLFNAKEAATVAPEPFQRLPRPKL